VPSVAAPRRHKRATDLIASPILFIIALAVAVLSFGALVRFAGAADIVDLAASIEKGSLPDADYLRRFIERNGLGEASTNCDDLFTRASLTVTLAALEAARRQNDAALSEAAEKNATHAAERRIDCNPLDGNAWLRYAMLRASGEGPAQPVIDALRLSYWTTPSEAWILETRLAFATNLYLAGATGFETEYLGDLRRYASYEPTGRVAAAYVGTAPRVQTQLRPLIETQPDERKTAIVAEIDRLGVDFGRR
jgi:hypothetical protein